ncbi:MAG: hypothetical protein GF313_07700 [Caldithrix sp.]|nr:hypothetical protein [Caldithrix sp.]
MSHNYQERLAKIWLFFYSSALVLISGIYLAAFVYSYSSEWILASFYSVYQEILLYLAGAGTFIVVPVWFLYQQQKKKQSLIDLQKALLSNFNLFLIFVFGLYLLYSIRQFDVTLRLADLIWALFAVYLIYAFQSRLRQHGYPAWQNVTTTVTLMLGVLKAAIFFFIWVSADKTIIYVLLVLLLTELFIVFLKFAMLNRFSQETRQTGRILLTDYSFLFGSRLILGIFIPLVYTFYQLFTGNVQLRFLAIFLLIGEILERYLFVYPAVPVE